MCTTTKYAHRSYIARFWYRAELLSIEAGNGTVSFVDYGNELTVPLTEIFQVRTEDLG